MPDRPLREDPDALARWGNFIRERVKNVAPDTNIPIYARPSVWLEVADLLDPKTNE